jgi:hypothetical protein
MFSYINKIVKGEKGIVGQITDCFVVPPRNDTLGGRKMNTFFIISVLQFVRFAVLYKSFIMSVNILFEKIENKTFFSVSQFFSLYVLQFRSIFIMKKEIQD